MSFVKLKFVSQVPEFYTNCRQSRGEEAIPYGGDVVVPLKPEFVDDVLEKCFGKFQQFAVHQLKTLCFGRMFERNRRLAFPAPSQKMKCKQSITSPNHSRSIAEIQGRSLKTVIKRVVGLKISIELEDVFQLSMIFPKMPFKGLSSVF